MKTFFQLSSRARKRHLRFIAKLHKRNEFSGMGVLFIRGEASFRQIERLHKAGLVTACASKSNWSGTGTRPFRELAVYLNEQEARQRYPWTVLPR
jgi:hypothetical protein